MDVKTDFFFFQRPSEETTNKVVPALILNRWINRQGLDSNRSEGYLACLIDLTKLIQEYETYSQVSYTYILIDTIEKLTEHEGFTELAYFQDALNSENYQEELVKELVDLATFPNHEFLTKGEQWAEEIINGLDTEYQETQEAYSNVIYEWACEKLGVKADDSLNFDYHYELD